VRTLIVGAGPTGLFIAIALARRGGEVVVVDRDPGPETTEVWRRKGVMQFHHAHSFRPQVVEALRLEMPDVLDDLAAAGATVAQGGSHGPGVLHCRRMVFERVLRARAAVEPGITVATGHVEGILAEGGRAVGLKAQRRTIKGDLVIDASGRASRVTAGIRPPPEGGPCGAAYVTRQYRLHNGLPGGPVNSPVGLSLSFPGYWAIVFLHDNRTFSVNLVHDGTDHRLRELRHDFVFESVVGQIPVLAEWVAPQTSSAITSVLPGGRLYNTYRGQLNESGRPALPGLISVGDAVCTTTPLAGRGIALSFLQARELVRLLDEHRTDLHSCTMEFDQWCIDRIKPWFDDHNYVDIERLNRWSGQDIDLSRPLPSDLIVAAADADPGLRRVVAAYVTMDALPASLAPAEPRARAIYADGWRPVSPPGPSIEQIALTCDRHAVDLAAAIAG
jgi:2-polyprenyl-6-methoxyphenol hydroxylase-like FAD-dependent oxidoreductase